MPLRRRWTRPNLADSTTVSITITDDDTGAGKRQPGRHGQTTSNPTIVESAVTYTAGTGTVSRRSLLRSGRARNGAGRLPVRGHDGGTTTYNHTTGPGQLSSNSFADTFSSTLVVHDPGAISVTDDDIGSTSVVHNVGTNLTSTMPSSGLRSRRRAKHRQVRNVVPVKVELRDVLPGHDHHKRTCTSPSSGRPDEQRRRTRHDHR